MSTEEIKKIHEDIIQLKKENVELREKLESLTKKKMVTTQSKKEKKTKNVCAIHILEENKSYFKIALIPDELNDGDTYEVIQMERNNFQKLAKLIVNTSQFSVQWNKYQILKEKVIYKDNAISAI